MTKTDAKTDSRGGLPIKTFANQAAFEQWLKGEGSGSKGAWLRFAKKGSSLQTLSKQDAIDAALCHGWIDGQLDKYDDESWLVRFTPRKPKSKWSKVNRERANELLAAGQIKPAGLAEIEAAKADGRWEAAYASASKATVPADFQTALDASPRAAAFFATLTGANRYAILYRVTTAKKPETRSKRIEQFIGMLERHETIHKPTSKKKQ